MRKTKIVATLGPATSSPAMLGALLDAGALVTAYDPKGMDQFRRMFPAIDYASDAYAAAAGASALAVVTEWEIFRALDLARLKDIMAEPVFVDMRNVYTAADVTRAGFRYSGIGTANAAAGS